MLWKEINKEIIIKAFPTLPVRFLEEAGCGKIPRQPTILYVLFTYSWLSGSETGGCALIAIRWSQIQFEL